MSETPPPPAAHPEGSDVRLIAFYLPQFHPIPENDAWWGEGFTEWVNVRKAKPNFAGHYQPHQPGELGYYDLRDPNVRERQAALAREHGIHAFCYYYYWFNGKRLLERPLDQMVASGKPDFPFCICWANENWTRRWDGLDQEILIGQDYSAEDNLAFIRALIPLLRDPRYLRVDGKPVVLIYKVALIPDVPAMAAVWRDECRAAGVGDLYIVAALTTWFGNPRSLGLDAAVEFPPHFHHAERVNPAMSITNPKLSGAIYGFRSFVAQLMTMPRPDFKLFRGLLPSWDNTARRQDAGSAFVGSSPELFQYWLESAIAQTLLRHRGDERLIFINAWNEWGEGCHLEPDVRYGRAYLEAVRRAREAPIVEAPRRPAWSAIVARAAADEARAEARIVRSPLLASGKAGSPCVSVVMPAYNHEAFVRHALDSVMGQTLQDLEIIAVDDGSPDRTGALLDEFAARCTTHALTVIHQANEGAHAAINRGLASARGEFVAVINSDDAYAPSRLQALVEAMRERDCDFAFSGTRFIDDEGTEIAGANGYVEQLREGIERCRAGVDPLLALLQKNVAISTGNFVFRRSLLERTGGFSSFRVCHDWDFVLAATYFTSLAFVPDALYDYRIHRGNTYSGLRLLAHLESDQVLDRFFEAIERHPVLREPHSRRRFTEEVDRRGLSGFLPPALRPAGKA